MLQNASGAPVAESHAVSGESERSRSPVFVVGCHRSGTNLLYDTLLSAGGFAIYRGYLPVYKVLVSRCGPLHVPANRTRAIDLFLRSNGFRRSGLNAQELSAHLNAKCRTGGDFMRIVMGGIAREQGVPRWALYDPDAAMYMHEIKRDIPNACFLHIVRDGRDIALSLSKMGGFRPFPWSSQPRGLLETAVYWEWMVRKAQSFGRVHPDSYLEVRYEELVGQPLKALHDLSLFLDQELEYDHIQKSGLGRLKDSNSSFLGDPQLQRHPVNRWKDRLSPREIVALESLVGRCLQDLGYPLTTTPAERKLSVKDAITKSFYPAFLDGKLWAKHHTPLGRFATLSELELDASETQSASQG